MSIRLTFHGAAGDRVTGSAYLLETERARVLVDFGLFQGGDAEEGRDDAPGGPPLPPGLDSARLDAVLLTHGHLDHTGRLPLLVRHGYAGPLLCTPATIEMTLLVLRDSVKLYLQDLERRNRKRARAGEPPLEPLYGVEEVEALADRFVPEPYGRPVPVVPGISACFVEAGHMLGSASIQLVIEDGGRRCCVDFSGDLGPRGAPILKDAEGFTHADAVVLESTYGDRDHKPLDATVDEFEGLVRDAVRRRSKILVPTFAIGRAQLLIYLLAQMFRERQAPAFPVFVDSPMALEACRIYERHSDLFDEEYAALNRRRPLAEDLATLRPVATAEESRRLNDLAGPCLILAGSGMATGGRIVHHLRNNLWKPETTVIIVGYQAHGTLGRRLVNREPHVTIFGEKVAVKAGIHTLGGFSAHAGQTDLVNWFAPLAAGRPRVFLTHGEARGRQGLAAKLRERFGLDAERPALGEAVELA